MDSDNLFWLRAIAIFAIILGALGTSFTELHYVEVLFRLLLISAGLLSFFKERVGIILLAVALAISIPDVEIGSLYWTPVRLIRFPIGGFISNSSGSYRFGIDVVSVLLFFLLIQSFNARKDKGN